MKRITFINPKVSWKFIKTPYPPLGIGYLAAVLREEWAIDIIDGEILDEKTYYKRLDNVRSMIIGITTTIKQMPEAICVAKVIKMKNPESIIIIGGSGTSVIMEPQFKEAWQYVDIIMKGEAELTLPFVLDQIYSNKKWHRISSQPSIIWSDTPSNLDKLPLPDRDLFPLENYLEIWKRNTGVTSTSMISSRGCPYRCIFCDKNISGYKFRARSAIKVVDEMEYLFKRYKVDDIFFYDDLFVFDKKRVLEICLELQKRNINISWSAQARVDRVDEEMLQQMKKSGCRELYFGAESGSNKILRYLQKGFTKDTIIEAFEICHKVGIKPGMYLIVGVPTENKEDLRETQDLIQKCRPYLLNFSYLMPFPGTPLFNKVRQWIKNYDYSQWDEMSSSILNYPFDINPVEYHNQLYEVFKDLVKQGMECSPQQFCCEQ